MKVLVLGKGGREHALAWALSRCDEVEEVHIAPGNAGTAECGSNVPGLDPSDPSAVRDYAARHGIGLVIPGSEAYLSAGVADAVRTEGVPVLGPGEAGARLETSKIEGCRFRERYAVSQPPFVVPETVASARGAAWELCARTGGVAVKADGLCGGKGVVVCRDGAAAVEVVEAMMCGGRFGEAGRRVVLQGLAKGPELSIFGLFDGERLALLPAARDWKRLFDGNRGPNTGGMGAEAPVSGLDTSTWRRIHREILEPTCQGLREEDFEYRGILYVGIALTEGGPQVLEYNVRFGDPETQVLLPLLDEDPGRLFLRTAAGRLESRSVELRRGSAVTVVLASEGYPESPRTGVPIEGLEHALEDRQALIFHAGTRREGERVLTAGGRVLAVTGMGPDADTAARRAYEVVRGIHFDGVQYRSGIGLETNDAASYEEVIG